MQRPETDGQEATTSKKGDAIVVCLAGLEESPHRFRLSAGQIQRADLEFAKVQKVVAPGQIHELSDPGLPGLIHDC